MRYEGIGEEDTVGFDEEVGVESEERFDSGLSGQDYRI